MQKRKHYLLRGHEMEFTTFKHAREVEDKREEGERIWEKGYEVE